MKKDPSILLEHILDSIETIERVLPKSETEFAVDRDTQDIVIRRLEIIGEATRHLPDELKSKWPEVEWRQLMALRNFLIHEYFNVDIELVWRNVQNYLPVLKRVIEELLEEIKKNKA